VLPVAAGGWAEVSGLLPALVGAPVLPLEPERWRRLLCALLEPEAFAVLSGIVVVLSGAVAVPWAVLSAPAVVPATEPGTELTAPPASPAVDPFACPKAAGAAARLARVIDAIMNFRMCFLHW
jgi:hypothetical protein